MNASVRGIFGALTSCTVSYVGQPTFDLSEDEMEFDGGALPMLAVADGFGEWIKDRTHAAFSSLAHLAPTAQHNPARGKRGTSAALGFEERRISPEVGDTIPNSWVTHGQGRPTGFKM